MNRRENSCRYSGKIKGNVDKVGAEAHEWRIGRDMIVPACPI